MKNLISIISLTLISIIAIGQISPEKVLSAKKHRVWCLAFSDDGEYVVSGGDDGAIIVYGTNNYNEAYRFEGLKGIPIAVCFSHDRKKIAAAGKDDQITIWNFNTKELLFKLKGHKEQIMDLEFSPDDKLIASASYDKTIKLWDAHTGVLKRTLKGHTKQVNSLSFSPNGKHLVTASGDKTIRMWEVNTSNTILNIPAHKGWVRTVQFSPDGSLIASGGDDRKIHLWDAYSGKRLNTFLGHKKWVMSLDFSPDGNYLLSGGQDNIILLTELKSGKMIFQSEKQSEKILAIAFNPNGKTFAFSALFDLNMEIWNAEKLNITPLDRAVAQKAASTSGMIPKIDWIKPKTDITTNEASKLISANISSESSLRKIELYVNNVLFSSKDRSELMLETAENNITKFDELIILNEGKNTIYIKAKNIVGEVSSTMLNINYSATPIELLSWLQPSIPITETSQSAFLVTANINKSNSNQQVTVLLNGNSVKTHAISNLGGLVSQNIGLAQGDNTISFLVKTDLYTKETESRIIRYTPALKPSISWVNPISDTISFISDINIRANINSKIPIDKIEIKVNGAIILQKQPLAKTSYILDEYIQIQTGVNQIAITALNNVGLSISQLRTITYKAAEKTNISWITPSANSDSYSSTIELKACVQSKNNMSSLKVYNNDIIIHSVNQLNNNTETECTFELSKIAMLNKGVNNFKIEVENIAGITYSENRVINYITAKLASANWIEPNSGQSSTTEKNFKLKACINSNTPILGIDLIINSQIISSEIIPQDNQSECSFVYEQLVSLNAGNNTIMLKVKNIAGESISQPLFIDLKTSNPYKFALIIGNEDYSSYQTGLDSESNVDFAKNDAKGFKELCLNKFGVKPEQIIYMEDARQIEMQRAINKLSLLTKASEGKAEIIVFYAGHGFPDEKTKEPFLIPVDVSGGDIAFGGGIKLSKFYELITQYPAKRVTVFIDACFSGGARNQGLVAARGVKVVPKKVDKAVTKNLIVYTASSGNETSLPYKQKEHGMFTYYLLEKINETNGNITYKELSDYLKYEVGIKSVLINSKPQQPQTNISPAIIDKWETWKFND